MEKYQITKYYLPFGLGLISIVIIFLFIFQEKFKNSNIVKIGDNYESCIGCHKNVTGFSVAHNPEAIGCASCHLGNPFTSDTLAAHENMVLIPGNLSDVQKTCGRSNCHPEISANLKNSLMATARGIVSVDRYVFGESYSPNGNGSFSELGHSPADEHMRNLCASCHLSNKKAVLEPISELSRGGGCLACHLHYSNEAEEQLTHYKTKKILPEIHPSLTIKATNDHCFGCHSRSGRISTNYEGWHEALLDSIPDTSTPLSDQQSQYRQLEDGRIFSKQMADVHFEKGLDCIDCHSWREAMGDGNVYYHQEDQVEISCEDCHFTGIPKTVKKHQIDNTDLKILNQRHWYESDPRFIETVKSGQALLNVQLDVNKIPFLKSKNSGKIYPLKSPLPICTSEIKGHNRLTCNSCHSAWAPQCLGCHTKYDPEAEVSDHLEKTKKIGGWVELSSDFYAEPPTLGIRLKNGKVVVDTFIPGMVFTITHKTGEELFRRLYAPTSPHTTAAKPRDCKSCHNDPAAVGFGRGILNYKKIESQKGKWIFTPKFANNPIDKLPQDAWTGFLQNREGMVSTRDGARPFNTSEQQVILQVGACLTCHEPNKTNLRNIYFHFEEALSKLNKECLLSSYESMNRKR